MNTGETQKVGTAALKKFKITAMIDDAGKIGVGIIDPCHQPVAGVGQHAGQADAIDVDVAHSS